MFFLSALILNVASQPKSCGNYCQSDEDCIQKFRLSPCTYCSNEVCISLCGLGCRTYTDCQNGGSNHCIHCSPTSKTCVNPNPLCGSYCPNNVACLINGTGTSSCGNCDLSTYSCVNSNNSKCGLACSGQQECAGDPRCSQCVGFFCSSAASCGQVCIGSGQCQSNPGKCRACINSLCSNYRSCGGGCGGDDWCSHECPVCGTGKCVKSREWNETIENIPKELRESFLAEAEMARKEVRRLSRMEMQEKPIKRRIY